MDHLEISIEANDSRWRERCNGRVKRLKNKQFHSSNSASNDGELMHKDLLEKEETMTCELYEAVRNGNVDAFVDVLEKECTEKKQPLYAITYQVTPAGDTLLHVAAEFGREKIAELIAYHYPEFLTWKNIKGDTPLHVAAKAKNLEVIKIILIEDAIQNPQYLLDLLDENGLTRIENKNWNTALHEAVLSKHVDGVALLLKEDRSAAHILNYSEKSALYLAVETGDVNILTLLLKTPFPSHKPLPQHHGNSPLHAAILERNPALLQMIVDLRPELMNLRDKDGGTALHYAAYTGYVEGVRILLNESNLTALRCNRKGHLPIHLACKMGHVKVVKELLQQEWPNAKILHNKKGQNILHIAAKKGKSNVIKYLLRNPKIDGFTLNERDKYGNTPLHLASKKFCPWTILHLSQDKRINLNLMNENGLTARDIVWLDSDIPRTRQQFLSEMILRSAGVPLKANMLNEGRRRRVSLSHRNDRNLKDAGNILILVGILIATVTFAAGFTVPGGVYSSDDPDPKKRGMAVLAHQTLFQIFMAFNMVAMYSSTLGSVILLWVQLGDAHFAKGVYGWAKLFVYVALITMSVAFMAAIRLVVSDSSLLANVVSVIGFIFIFLIIFVRVLGRFPLGVRLPLLRPVGELFIRMILILFYGRHDVRIGEDNNEDNEITTFN